MKKLYTLFFLLLMLLNTFGYWRFLTFVEQQYFDQTEEKIIGNEDDIAGNLLLRLPLQGPYGYDDDHYISVRGEVTYEGLLYHFVKKKVYRDTLYIVCLRDEATMKARNAVSDYAQSFAEPGQQKTPSAKKRAGSFFMDYILSGVACEQNDQRHHGDAFCETPGDLYRCRPVGSIFRPPCYSDLSKS